MLKNADILRDYSDVFEGLGNLPGDIYIEFDTSVQHLPRGLPETMKGDKHAKTFVQFRRVTITKVSGSTDLIKSMVATKNDTKLKELNQAI